MSSLRSLFADPAGRGWARFRSALVLAPALAAMGLGGGCGGSSSGPNIQVPVVRNFSPVMSPIDFLTFVQNPTFTDSGLVLTTADPIYHGKIVIFFQAETSLAPSSVFIGGNPVLGVDPNSLFVTQEIPGVGNVPIPIDVTVESDRIICQPLPPFSAPDGAGGFVTNMPDGQYTIGVLRNITDIQGRALRDAPVFHSFTVGAADNLAPRVVTTAPINNAVGVGAGAPPPEPPAGLPTASISDVRTNIFGPTSPDIVIRFSEGILAQSVSVGNFSVVDAGAFVPGGGAPPALAPAPGFPRLKSDVDRQTLPSNGHEVIWRPDTEVAGGFPFGTIISCTVLGLWNTEANMAANPGTPDNAAPLQDLAGNFMEVNYVFQFETLAPPNLPANPIPEYAIWWSSTDSVGAIDSINHKAIAEQFLGATFPQGIPINVLPQFTGEVSTEQNLRNFDPFEIIVDPRDGFVNNCHTYVYVQSEGSSQVAIINSRNSVPVALINTPRPGGIALAVADLASDMLLVTNSSANTFTAFSLNNILVGRAFLTAPIFISKVQPAGNSPRAIVVSTPPRDESPLVTATWNRDLTVVGPSRALIMWADQQDGAVNTITLGDDTFIKRFPLGPAAQPNDLSMSPCFGGLMFTAISRGGNPGEGGVHYYVSGLNCSSGTQTPGNPDAVVGKTNEPLDAPDGLDQVAQIAGGSILTDPIFVVAESGSTANAVAVLGLETGQINLPRLIDRIENVGSNPTSIAHRPPWSPQLSFFDPNVPNNGTCNYENVLLWNYYTDPVAGIRGLNPLWIGGVSLDPSTELYVCAAGSGVVRMVNLLAPSSVPALNGGIIPIAAVRHVGSQCSQ